MSLASKPPVVSRNNMKYYVTTPRGETGPHTPEQLGFMYQKGEIKEDYLCRAEDSDGARRLDVVFPRLSKPSEVAVRVERDAAIYDRKEGDRQIFIGVLFMAYPVTVFVFSGSTAGIPLACLLLGIGILSRGAAQRRRGVLKLAAMGWEANRDEEKAPSRMP